MRPATGRRPKTKSRPILARLPSFSLTARHVRAFLYFGDMSRYELNLLLPSLRQSGLYEADPVLAKADAPTQQELASLPYMLADRQMLRLLRQDLVLFTFFRVTYGSQRRAIGTLNQELFSYSFKGGTAPDVPGLYRYWDVVRAGWRSFYLKNVKDYSRFEAPGAR